ncbi:hypothetical protein H8356DRAFT_1309084 [Neocallimastix lanati (nom. inval.)]|uniref:G-protein coupled receptors family 1 profile domain-containing protein n=1 Tax=Neocallimastix californiae TaxID=1754190 RepID=A0A1Y2ENE4_9FUNG|nr:hypothetical protein H8356DRAFT_1309084 [Neocallimastix sp. JGI-2020a]ORY72365.1 hypothetical protein LY90DRAFT_667238 [Neocallimastix californiae]|eukprot:ORY72365.1 hypothetical protein LY90DRAFT_667238 [Neocallimastix californiae]
MFDREKELINDIDFSLSPEKWTLENIFLFLQTPFKNIFFPWIVIILIINRNNWKKTIIYILLFHYIFRTTGDLLRSLSNAIPVTENRKSIWPYSVTRFNVGCIMAYFFWATGEIIGDWYPTVRACKIVHSKKKKILLKSSCIIYNFSKMSSFLVYIYYGRKIQFKNKTMVQDSKIFDELLKHWWITVIVHFIFSLINDACVIYALKTEVFNKLKTLKGRSYGFVENFKQISELRIILSMIVSICFIFFTIPILMVKFKECGEKDKKVTNVFDQFEINTIRDTVVSFNHIMMYIDQVLLKYISTNPSKKMPKLNTIPESLY